jgi:hypothetical protein
VAVLVLLAVAAVMAVFPLRCRPLAALAVVTLVISLGSLVTYSGIPLQHGSLSTLGYLILVLFPIGVLSWLVVGSWAVLTGRLVLRRLATTRLAGRAVPGAGPLAGLAATALLTVGAILALSLQGHTVHRITSDPAMAATSAASRQIVRKLPGQPIALWVHDFDPTVLGRLTLGLTWALTPEGFHAEITHTRLARELGDRYMFRGQAIPMVKVRVRRHVTLVAVTKPTQLASHS